MTDHLNIFFFFFFFTFFKVHVHIKRIKIEDMPTEELETKKWLLESFKTKDQLMGNFKKNGSFSQKVGGGDGLLLGGDCVLPFRFPF